MAQNYGIHWFRRDLRVAGNETFHESWKRHEGHVVGFFCFDKEFLSRPDFSQNRFQLFIESLVALQNELREIGSDLLFMDVGPQKAFPQMLKKLKNKPSLISWGRDYEPFARKRDEGMALYFKEQGIRTLEKRDHLLIEPEELSKKGKPGEWYQVYSPFARQWLSIYQDEEIQKRVKRQKAGIKYLKNRLSGNRKKFFNLKWDQLLSESVDCTKVLEDYSEDNKKGVTIPIPDAGSLAAFKVLESYKEKIDRYSEERDYPSLLATSGFSPYLKNGTLTVPQIISYFDFDSYEKKKNSRDTFLSELIWREFYYHILFHKPKVESDSFLAQYQKLPWENNQKWFEAWKNGMTGFPIVDAGMRQLKQTGLMHNRVRMIVASFLTKDLLINWQWGEKYFMEELLDGDLAPNNGGWQWAASTGCDPQPYFRIFNPWSQSQKFDAQGDYIKKYIPELKDLPAKELHQPVNHPNYPKPIVDHKVQREKALALYKSVRVSS